MALDYFAPGVYVEEVDRGSRPIEGVSMSVAGFVGFTEDVRGDAELFKPMMVTNWNQYLELFGKPGSDGFTDFDAYLPFAVNGWFLNGGGRCWVTSIGTQLPGSESPPPEETGLKIFTSGNRPSLRFNLKLPEAEGEAPALPSGDGRIQIVILESEPKPLPDDAPEDAEPPLNNGEYFSVAVTQGDRELERYDHLTMNPEPETEVADYVVTALQESEYVEIADLSQAGQPLSRRPTNGLYEVVPPPYIAQPERFPRDLQGQRDDRTGMQGIFEIDEVSTIACPDLMRAYQAGLLDIDQIHGVMEMMVSMCENASPSPPYRMVVLDPPPVKPGKGMDPVLPEQQKPQDVAQWLSAFNRRSMFAALYYPWIKVANPRNAGRPISVPPCGHMMGIWCRTDESRGVFKAPANETPRGVIGLAYDTNMREQELLNPLGINCIRNFATYNRGYKVWGARTLVEPDNIQWRYISVRRLISYIERSIEMGTQWVVFEPNDMDLWERVKRTVSNFLEGLWRAGALFGGSPAEAFYVKCDADLNTHETMMKGRLYIEVGVCPVRPAEFVIFRVSQWAPNQ
ncbi:phage tail sheath family protein [Oxynema aestuarii]|jgi:phage tail sheath protein FI|uniref:Phage tail sheath family protein n=1 Tax=Oxynema aestuarii AP17 TaxID=2064643 RepID=A0A6H1TV16_9CYAN|nr:phage tail sheath C-terminal domain-containing protein [Oxynema aestuarii]QIZ70401.1 phage tail sheath family protein [Oxynema aestuarii AP17]RMH73067.1 MAG: phage tail sheath family protein [Cyanobacteria bacterium J007]